MAHGWRGCSVSVRRIVSVYWRGPRRNDRKGVELLSDPAHGLEGLVMVWVMGGDVIEVLPWYEGSLVQSGSRG